MKSVFYSLLNHSRTGSSSLWGFWDAQSQTLIGGKSLAMRKTWECVGRRRSLSGFHQHICLFTK